MMPPIFPTNQDQLRKEIKGMHTVHRKPKKMSGIDANASLWTPEKQMENEFTRNRMKTLLRRKKHAPILSGTPVDSEIGSAQTWVFGMFLWNTVKRLNIQKAVLYKVIPDSRRLQLLPESCLRRLQFHLMSALEVNRKVMPRLLPKKNSR